MKRRMMNPLSNPVFLGLGSFLLIATPTIASMPSLDFQGRIRSAFLYETTKEDVLDVDTDGNVILNNGKAETSQNRSSRMGFLADSKMAAEGVVEHDGINATAYFEMDVQDNTKNKASGGFNLYSRDAWVKTETDAFYLKIGRQDFNPFYAFKRPYLAFNTQERLMGSLIGFDSGVLLGTHCIEGWDLKLGLKVDSLDTENILFVNPVAMRTFDDGTELGVAATHKTVEGEPDRGGDSEQEESAKQLSLWYKGKIRNWQPYINLQGSTESSENLDKANLKTESDINTSEVFLGLNYILEQSMVTTSLYHQLIHDKTDGDSSDSSTQVLSLNYGREVLTGFMVTAGLNTTLTVFESKLLDNDSSVWSYTAGLSYYF